MAVNTKHVLRLIEELAETLEQPMDYKGFGLMSDVLDDSISQRYLDDLYRDVRRKIANEIEFTRKSRIRLDLIAQYLKYKNFNQFSLSYNKRFSDLLSACIGNWWSYVRANTGEFILKAPARIFQDDNKQKILMELRGGERTFVGELIERGGCMTGFLDSGTEKRLCLVFKLGNSRQIRVAQGIFTGISTSGNPIGGRELLVRELNVEYQYMQWGKYTINDDRIDSRILSYFSSPEKNCIQIASVGGFELDDLKIN